MFANGLPTTGGKQRIESSYNNEGLYDRREAWRRLKRLSALHIWWNLQILREPPAHRPWIYGAVLSSCSTQSVNLNEKAGLQNVINGVNVPRRKSLTLPFLTGR
jgi:hypothetical protein